MIVPGPSTAKNRRLAPLRVAAVWAAGSWLAASAADAGGPRDTCFARRQVESFSAPDDRTVYLRVGGIRYYRLDLMTDCLDLTFRQGIGLKDQPADAFICSPLKATVVYRAAGGFPQRCPVKAIHKLTPAEVAALPRKDKP